MAKKRSPERKAIDALQRLSQARIQTGEQYESYTKEVAGQGSERGVGIILVTTVEDALQGAIESRLSIKSDQHETFFGVDAPMGTFSNKIRMGTALEIFGEDTRQNLMLLKAIRNTFAHSKIAISFDTTEIIEACNLLKMPSIPARSDGIEPRWSVQFLGYKGRPRFQMVCSGHASSFGTYAVLANSQRHPSDQPDNRYEMLVRPKSLR